MTRLPGIVEARRENARALMAGLAGIQGLVTPTEGAGRRHVFHQFTVRLTTEARVTRSELLRHLRGRGIQCAVYYPRPVFDYYCFRSDPRVGNPAAPTSIASPARCCRCPSIRSSRSETSPASWKPCARPWSTKRLTPKRRGEVSLGQNSYDIARVSVRGAAATFT